jgi:hypothetical protein
MSLDDEGFFIVTLLMASVWGVILPSLGRRFVYRVMVFYSALFGIMALSLPLDRGGTERITLPLVTLPWSTLGGILYPNLDIEGYFLPLGYWIYLIICGLVNIGVLYVLYRIARWGTATRAAL